MDYNGIINKFSEKKILVIGDIMLDEYIIGDVERISPEAPIPVVLAKDRKFVLGGAANTANNLSALGAKTVLCGMLGKDETAKKISSLLEEKKIANACISVEGRKTTRKTRIIARNQQMLRVDEEETTPITQSTEKKLLETIAKEIKNSDAIVVSDYAKGLFSKKTARSIISLAKAHGKIVCVDSKNLKQFRGATLIKPNRKELERETGKTCSTIDACEKAAILLFKKLRPNALLVTMGADGMLLAEAKNVSRIKSKAAEVFDVSGAGDTVLATATLALASGATMQQAAEIASFAASVVIRKLGTATLNVEELQGEINSD